MKIKRANAAIGLLIFSVVFALLPVAQTLAAAARTRIIQGISIR